MSNRRTLRIGLAVWASLALLSLSVARADEKGDPVVVEIGKRVSIEYKLSLDDGTVVDTNAGNEPLVFEPGARQILPALEQALLGLEVDETKNVKLSPEEGYGPVNPAAFESVPSEQIPEDARQVGAVLVAQDAEGNKHLIRVHEMKDETVVLDYNHPLAGQNLNFDIKILAVE